MANARGLHRSTYPGSSLASRLARAYSILRFGYDATESKNRRKAPDGVQRGEDYELPAEKRRKLVSGARDLPRNFAVASWAIRKHLDYVSSFSFRATSRIDEIDEPLTRFVDWWSRKENFDVAGRHRLSRFVRLAEARRTLDGDIAIVKLANGQVQAIEGDRIKNPNGLPNADWCHGVRVDAQGRALSYALHNRRSDSTLIYDRDIPAKNLILHGYYDRFDQVRGISPLAPALNTLRDTYEGFDYALAKLKVSQLFGLVFTRAGSEEVGNVSTETDDDGETQYTIDFGRGPAVLDLDPGDDAKFLESNSPSDQFQNFTQIMISVALKALDIPFSFFDESHTNYSGARQAMLQYEDSAQVKREDNRELLRDLTRWRLQIAIERGELILPQGIGIDDLEYDWIHRGTPWIDPLKEAQADLALVAGGLTSRQRILKARNGDDFWKVAEELADEIEFARKLGLNLTTSPAEQATPNEATGSD